MYMTKIKETSKNTEYNRVYTVKVDKIRWNIHDVSWCAKWKMKDVDT